jgi:hypothetical protein
MRTFLASVFVIALEVSSALAGVVTRCERPTGYTYYFSGALIPKDKAGWQKDGISKGSYLVTRDAAGEYDIVFTDALNRTISSRVDGGRIVMVSQSDDHLILIVNYPEMNVETWYFNVDRMGIGKVTISQARYGSNASINKHSLMTAICSR